MGLQFQSRVVRRDSKNSRSSYITLPPVFVDGWNVQTGDVLILEVIEIKKMPKPQPTPGEGVYSKGAFRDREAEKKK